MMLPTYASGFGRMSGMVLATALLTTHTNIPTHPPTQSVILTSCSGVVRRRTRRRSSSSLLRARSVLLPMLLLAVSRGLSHDW
eukprot:740399-Rhodomonas_salina.2